MHSFDVCNGDADGLIARHQYRLSFPLPAERVTLVTGLKREVALLLRVETQVADLKKTDICVFDISYDQNAASALRLLEAGATIRYFDHHRASQLRLHPRLASHIDTSADICTSLIVDHHLGGAHRAWAIAAAFGDNLIEIAEQHARQANLTGEQSLVLRQLGECINYNAYGDSVSDLHFPPEEIARRLQPYQSPFDFAQHEDILDRLRVGMDADLRSAHAIQPHHESSTVAVYILPDERWARRVSGTFANALVHAKPDLAHAVLNTAADGSHTVSIRAPQSNPLYADAIAIHFPTGGGRAAAAGINRLKPSEIPALIALLEQTYSGATDRVA